MRGATWSEEDKQTVIDKVPSEGVAAVAKLLGRTPSSVSSLTKKLGVRVSPECLAKTNRASSLLRYAGTAAARPDRQRRHELTGISDYNRRKRKQAEKARAQVEAGQTSAVGRNMVEKKVLREMQEIVAAEKRAACPIERAKSILQRRYAPVVSETIYGGTPGRFRVGAMKDVTAQDLLSMADDLERRRLAA